MKVFIGIVPPPEILAKIQVIQADDEFTKSVRVPRNSPPHITLLRPQQADDPESYAKATQTACAGIATIEVSLGGTGYFKNNILYLKDGSSRLPELHHKICRALNAPQEPNFLPHLTLGRLRQHGRKPHALDLNVSFHVETITVFGREIENTPYRVLAEVHL